MIFDIPGPLKNLLPGNLDSWRGPYPTPQAACDAIANVVVDGRNFREGKIVDIGIEPNTIAYGWKGGFENINLVKLSASSDQGVLFQTTTVSKSTNILNTGNITLDFYPSPAGVLTPAAAGSEGFFAVTNYIPWDTHTQYIAGKNGVVYRLFAVAQYDANYAFISGSYAGTDNVNGAVSKVSGAEYFRVGYKIANVNQINFGATVLPYELYYPSVFKKIGKSDANGVDATFKPDISDTDLNSTFSKSGGSSKTLSQVDQEKASKSQGVNFTTTTILGSNNFLNTSNIVIDKYPSPTGALDSSDPAFLGVVATTDYIEWGTNTQFIGGRNGVGYKLFSVAQYDANKIFISGSYTGNDNVTEVVSKATGAVYFKVAYKIANVNQLSFGASVLPYDAYIPTVTKKKATADANGTDAVFKPDLDDPGLSEFSKSGGSTKTLQQIDNEKSTKAQGVTYTTVITPGSNNFLNTAASTIDLYPNLSGTLDTAGLKGLVAMIDYKEWGNNTQFIGGKNGVAANLFSINQYDANKVFIPGSYVGVGNVVGAVTKMTGAVYFRLGYEMAKINQLNFGSSILPYDAYFPATSKKIATGDANGVPAVYPPNLEDPGLAGLIQPAKTTETMVAPSSVYAVCNNLELNGFKSMNFAAALHIDHMFDPLVRKKINFRSTKGLSLPVFAPIAVDNSLYNGGVPVLNTTITDVLEGDIVDTNMSFNRRSVLLSAVAGKFIASLKLGDSTVAGVGSYYPISVTGDNIPGSINPAQSWSYAKKLNILYKAQNGGVGFNYVSVGRTASRNFIVNGTTHKAYAEGIGGWAVNHWLYNRTGPFNGVNGFYDADKVGSVKFSLAKYLSRYRTMTDTGVRLSQSDPSKGTEVTDVTAYDVCTPTHFTIQLGFNDVASEFRTNLPLLINAIKTEFPNMIILISMIDASGTLFPEQYQMFNKAGVDLLNNEIHRKIFGLIDFVKGLESTSNRIYFCPNYFIQPTAWGVATRDINYPEFLANPILPFMMQQEHGSSSRYHPNTYAHAAWGYQEDSLCKYTAMQHL